jgi:hypothetical protein
MAPCVIQNEVTVTTTRMPFPNSSLSDDALLQSAISMGQRPNVLVHCGGMSVEAAAGDLAGLSVQPTRICLLPGPLHLPESGSGTLVVGDVSLLTIHQQRALCDWMDNRDRAVQVISITSTPLLPLVQAGRFLDRLFYRLNLISVATATRNAAVHSPLSASPLRSVFGSQAVSRLIWL